MREHHSDISPADREAAIDKITAVESEAAFEALDFFNKNQSSEEFYERHQPELDAYFEDPVYFFSEQNLEALKKMNSGERLILLAKVGGRLTATPEMAANYFEIFPQDLPAIIIAVKEKEALPQTGAEYNLFSLCALEVIKNNPTLVDTVPAFRHFIDIADRKNIAPDFLLDGEINFEKKFGGFGDAAAGFRKAMAEASELSIGGMHIINAQQIFTPEYQALPDEQKANFLRNCLSQIQYDLVFEETYNSSFTPKFVSDDKIRTKKNSELSGRTVHNPAHSMLYKTYQPHAVYDLSEGNFVAGMNATTMSGGYPEEYPYHRLLLAVLGQMKDTKADTEANVDVVVDFWQKNRNPIFGNAVADVLSSQDPTRGAAKLLEAIRAEKDSPTPLAAILYRLEFGRVGISDDGVKYLEKMYDLGEYNKPDYHVSRLTADGEVGIFDEELALVKYFHLGDLASPEKKVRAKVLDFVYETLFSESEGETETDRKQRLQYLEEFKQNYYQIANNEIFTSTGVRLNNLSFKEQGWFTTYFNQATEPERQALRGFVQQYEETGMKTFLACEYGLRVGQEIIEIGSSKKYGETAARETFQAFTDIATQAEEISQIIFQHELVQEDPAFASILDQFPIQLREAIVRRAKDTLFAGAAVARAGRATTKFYGGKSLEVTSANEVVGSLNDYRTVLEKINCLLQPVEQKKAYQFKLIDHEAGTPESHQFTITNMATGSDSFLTLQLRRYGAAVGEHNSEREYDGEARINFLFSDEPIPLDATDSKRQHAMSIRLDREGKERSGNTIVANDPTQQAGELSLDISSSDQRLGRVVAIGNALAAESAAGRRVDPQYLHNRESFNRTLGDAETFAHIANVISQQIKQYYPPERPPA